MKKIILIWFNLLLACVIGFSTIYGLTNSFGFVPSLAKTFHPQTGIWTSASPNAVLPSKSTINIAELEHSVQVIFEQNGTPHIKAKSNRDAWIAIGYLHASFRLFQMDITRRQGAGLLSQVMGENALEADKFQRQLNLTRTAETEWKNIKQGSDLHAALTSYTAGVNSVIKQKIASNDLPLMFKVLGYEPELWKPQDSLIIKGVLTQTMSLNMIPAYYALFEDTLGPEITMDFFPAIPTKNYYPYNTSSPTSTNLAPMSLSTEAYFKQNIHGKENSQITKKTAMEPETLFDSETLKNNVILACSQVIKMIDKLPPYAIHRDSNSNAWVVDGTKTKTGKPILANDPHLSQTLPSIWYQIQVEAPDYRFAGVGIPGIPNILIGHNDQITWGLTNGQNQQAFYYYEKINKKNPNQYFSQGQWHDMDITKHIIPVKGGKSVPFEVRSTIHGPIINAEGLELSLNWTGTLPSKSLEGLFDILKAKDYKDFQFSLEKWASPIMNFVYADQNGNIGIIGAGHYPVFPTGSKPWLPMPGTGESEIIGRIPFEDIPQAYNPPEHFIGTANQLQVAEDYPYYIGTAPFFEPGYRAERIHEVLSSSQNLSADALIKLQADVYEPLAAKIVPVLLNSLSGKTLNNTQQQAVSQLSTWDYRMTKDSIAASIWWIFLENYLKSTFEPWFKYHKFPLKDHKESAINYFYQSSTHLLETWTLHDPKNKYFYNPVTNEERDAFTVMTQAFEQTIQDMERKYGKDIDKWEWQRLHTRKLVSVAQIPALGYGPKGAEGDLYTLNVAGGLEASHGPTWRMVVDLSSQHGVGIYPGGQSENPISPWYQNHINNWWNSKYSNMISFHEAENHPNHIRWSLLPTNSK